MTLPKILARCDWCQENAPEVAGHRPEEVAWGESSQQWLCNDCWAERENVHDEDITPMVWASDVLLDDAAQADRLVVAAARRRILT
jgi:hypothetical protein